MVLFVIVAFSGLPEEDDFPFITIFMSGSIPFTIVLANLMSQSGQLNEQSVERADLAIELEKLRYSQRLILCGWDYRSDSDLPIAEALRSYIGMKCPEMSPKLACQSLSRDTVGDAFFARLLIERVYGHSDPTVLVVTSDYHLKRASAIFRFVFSDAASIVVKGSKTSFTDVDFIHSESSSLRAFRQTFDGVRPGDVQSIYERLLLAHPFYNGFIYPKIGSLASIVQSLVSIG